MTVLPNLDILGANTPRELTVSVSKDNGISWESDIADASSPVASWDIADNAGAPADARVQPGAFSLVGIDWAGLYTESFEDIARQCSVKDRGPDFSENYAQESFVKMMDSNARGCWTVPGLLAAHARKSTVTAAFLGIPVGSSRDVRRMAADTFWESILTRSSRAVDFWAGYAIRTVNLAAFWSRVAAHQNIDGLRNEARLTSVDRKIGASEDSDGTTLAELLAGDADLTSDILGSVTVKTGATVTNLSPAMRADAIGGELLIALDAGDNSERYQEMIRECLAPTFKTKQDGATSRRMVKVLVMQACGFEAPEICDALGISKGTLPKMYQRARAYVQKCLATVDGRQEMADQESIRAFAQELEGWRARHPEMLGGLLSVESDAPDTGNAQELRKPTHLDRISQHDARAFVLEMDYLSGRIDGAILRELCRSGACYGIPQCPCSRARDVA